MHITDPVSQGLIDILDWITNPVTPSIFLCRGSLTESLTVVTLAYLVDEGQNLEIK